MPTTTNHGFPFPQGSDPADVPADMGSLAGDLDDKVATADSGAIASRPAAGTQNRFYYATDEERMYHDTGSSWEIVPNWAGIGKPYAIQRSGGGESPLTGVWTPLGTPTVDYNGYSLTIIDNDEVDLDLEGMWLMGGQFYMNAKTADTDVGIAIALNGSRVITDQVRMPSSSAGFWIRTICHPFKVNAGDDFSLQGYQNSGTTGLLSQIRSFAYRLGPSS